LQGCVVKVEKDGADGIATIKLTDFKGLRIMIPVSEAVNYVIDEPDTEHKPKRQREEPAECVWKPPPPPKDMPTSGPALEEFVQKLDVECHGFSIKPGTRVWVNLGSANGNWPALVWSLMHCRKDDLADVILTHKPGHSLVAFYGEHSLMWVKPCKLRAAVESEDVGQIEALEHWAKKNRQQRLVKDSVMEMLCAEKGSIVGEIKRFQQLYDMTTRYGRHMCHACGAPKAPLKCSGCDRRFHTMCLPLPALTEDHLPDGDNWTCPCCDNKSTVDKEAAARAKEGDGAAEEEGDGAGVQKMGLTPDWIISAAAFDVFGLDRPTPSSPVIKGLLDPCTNSKVAPNIPAEKLFDKNDNGLKLSNVWKGYYVLLNPDFTAQIQWRFVNRAIDEVESESVPAVILICRNSTDTAFYQRLRPYPRVNLKRVSVLFKDYNHTPIGFGISIFCMASKDVRRTLYPKFFSAFGGAGEPLIPVDGIFVQKPEFWELLDRLGEFTGSHHRDHWVKCSECAKWRMVSVQTIKRLESSGDDNDNDNWTCEMLDPPRSSCSTPLTKMEYVGGHYVVNDNEDDYDPEFKLFDFRTEYEGQEHARVDKKRVQERLESVIQELRRMPSTYKERTAFNAGAEDHVVDIRSSCALELARKARIAANKAYLQALGSEARNNASGTLGRNGLGEDDASLVTTAAKKLAGHVARTICATEVEKARFEYKQAMHNLAKEEQPLKRELERIQTLIEAAKRNVTAAETSAELIEREFAILT